MPSCCIQQHRNPLGKVWCIECMSLVAGASIGDYVIVSYLGQGSTSAVYLAQQPKLNNRKVVIKVLHSVTSQESIVDFRQEAAVLASLSHPYILPIYDFDIIEEVRVDQMGNYSYSPYLVLPYTEQGSLDEVFKREGNRPWSLQRVLPIIKEAAEALDYAHSRGVLHRDVKPANILLSGTHIMLADFGMASLIDADTSHLDAPWAGSPAYMAPEVWRFKPGRYTDQYALAVTCYRLLTGEYPWKLATGGTTHWMNVHLHVAPQPLRTYRPDLPLEVGLVLARALTKERHDRYPSVVAFATDLRHAAHEETQQLASAPQPPRPSPPSTEVAILSPAANVVQVEIPGGESQPPAPTVVAESVVPPLQSFPQDPYQNGADSIDLNFDVTGSLKWEITQGLLRDRWTLPAFILNVVICATLLIVGGLISSGAITPLLLASSLCPILGVGPLVGRLFHHATLPSPSWGVLWGMIFGIGNAFLSALACCVWTVLFTTLLPIAFAPFLSQAMKLVLPPTLETALMLFFIGLWMSILGGALIGLFAARAAIAKQAAHQR